MRPGGVETPPESTAPVVQVMTLVGGRDGRRLIHPRDSGIMTGPREVGEIPNWKRFQRHHNCCIDHSREFVQD
jgi:hypothetical protein